MKPTQALKSARLRVSTLQAELVAPETIRLGKAAGACVQGALDDAEYQLAALEAADARGAESPAFAPTDSWNLLGA
jgi:hypothetical protein